MTSAVAPSFVFAILVDRTEDSIPTVTATRESLLNTSRTLALVAGLVVLVFGGDVYALYVIVGGVILLEAFAKGCPQAGFSILAPYGGRWEPSRTCESRSSSVCPRATSRN